MIMKKVYSFFAMIAGILLPAMLTGCNSESQIYEGPSYVMFADTMNVCPVFQDGKAYEVPLSATQTMPYDRTFAVEILQQKSNAIEGYHYTIESNTVTVPAGEMATSVKIKGNYEHIEEEDSLNIRLRLVLLDEEQEWDYYGLETNVSFQKICPFDVNTYTGYAIVSSTFLYAYNHGKLKRLITTERVEGEENTVLLHDFMSDGYDVKLTFNNSDPLRPRVSVEEGAIIAPTEQYIGTMLGDNMLRIADYANIESKFMPCRNLAALYSLIFVYKEGYLGAFATTIEWISDVEAEDILKNGF